MKKYIKLLILALGFGLCAFSAHAEGESCDRCNATPKPSDCPPDDDDDGPGESMPEGIILDDMSADAFAE